MAGQQSEARTELVIVPTERHVEEEAARSRSALSFRKLTRSLADRAAQGRSATTPEMTRLLTAELRGGSFGFAVSLDAAIGTLRRAGTQASDLANVESARAKLLGETLTRAEERLAACNLRDERADAWLATLALEQTEIPELHGIRRVSIRGLTRWENADLALIEALHRALVRQGGQGVYLELPAERADHTGPAVDKLARELEERWAAQSDSPYLEFASARRDATHNLTLIEAQHEASEARAVVRRVLDAIAQGAAIDRIAIVPIDLTEAFLEPLRAGLRAARLPFSEPRGRPAIAAPEAHAALELMRLSRGPLSRDSLIDILRVPSLRLERWLGQEDRRLRYAFTELLASLPLRVDRTGNEMCEALAARAQSHHDDSERETAERLLAVLRSLIADLERLGAPTTRAQFRTAWLAMFEALGLFSTAPNVLARALARAEIGAPDLLRALGENSIASEALATALERIDQAATALGLFEQTKASDALLTEFETALAGVGPVRGARRAGALRIARASEAAGLDWDLVVICRASSSSLDWSSAGGEAVLSEELRRLLPPRRRPPSAADANRFRLLSLSWILSRAEQATITWATRDAQGVSGPSRLVLDYLSRGVPSQTEPASPLDARAHRISVVPQLTPNARQRIAIEQERAAFFSDPATEATIYTGRAGDLRVLLGGTSERPIALTALERYLRCPFLAFASSGLKAARDELVSDAIGVRERGTLLHDALAKALESIAGKLGTDSASELEEIAMRAALNFLEQHGKTALRRAGMFATLKDVRALVHWSLKNAEGLGFLEAERAFGSQSEWSALALGEWYISGRIDRIDANSDRSVARVIDYKSGKRPAREAVENELLQPYLYARKVAEELGAKRVTAAYLALNRRRPEVIETHIESKDDAAVQDAEQRALKVLRDFANGHVAPRPADARSCVRCDARDICRRPLSAPADEEDE